MRELNLILIFLSEYYSGQLGRSVGPDPRHLDKQLGRHLPPELTQVSINEYPSVFWSKLSNRCERLSEN